jgi:hypothetical protein
MTVNLRPFLVTAIALGKVVLTITSFIVSDIALPITVERHSKLIVEDNVETVTKGEEEQ